MRSHIEKNDQDHFCKLSRCRLNNDLTGSSKNHERQTSSCKPIHRRFRLTKKKGFGQICPIINFRISLPFLMFLVLNLVPNVKYIYKSEAQGYNNDQMLPKITDNNVNVGIITFNLPELMSIIAVQASSDQIKNSILVKPSSKDLISLRTKRGIRSRPKFRTKIFNKVAPIIKKATPTKVLIASHLGTLAYKKYTNYTGTSNSTLMQNNTMLLTAGNTTVPLNVTTLDQPDYNNGSSIASSSNETTTVSNDEIETTTMSLI